MVKQSLKFKIAQATLMGITYAGIMVLFARGSGEEFHLWKFIFQIVFFGGTMGFILPLITEYVNKKALDKIVVELADDEKLKLESRANLNGGTGKIILTDRRLIFKEKDTSKNNFVDIPLNEIIEVEKHKTLGFIHNVFKVKTASKEYKFIVYENERDTWVSALHNSSN